MNKPTENATTKTSKTATASPAVGRDLLTVEQAATLLQLSPSSIRSYIRQGKLKAFRVAGLRKVLIARSDLMNLLEPARVADPTSELIIGVES